MALGGAGLSRFKELLSFPAFHEFCYITQEHAKNITFPRLQVSSFKTKKKRSRCGLTNKNTSVWQFCVSYIPSAVRMQVSTDLICPGKGLLAAQSDLQGNKAVKSLGLLNFISSSCVVSLLFQQQRNQKPFSKRA